MGLVSLCDATPGTLRVAAQLHLGVLISAVVKSLPSKAEFFLRKLVIVAPFLLDRAHQRALICETNMGSLAFSRDTA